MKFLTNINLFGEKLALYLDQYRTGGKSLDLVAQNFEPFARLTVIVPSEKLEPGEFCVKTWNENGPLRGPLLATGLFKDTGKRFASGLTIGEIWKFTPDAEVELAI